MEQQGAIKKFEEYKLFVESTDRYSDRIHQISNIYLTVNSIIIVGIAFLVKDAVLDTYLRSIVIIVILLVGIVVCDVWKQIIYKYKKLIAHRIGELREIENHADMENCHKMYHSEDKLYPRDENNNPIKGEGLNISDKEKWLPNIFFGIYSLSLIGVISYSFAKYFIAN